MTELSPKSLADLRKLADAYKGSDKEIRNGIRKGLQAAAKPLAEKVIREGAAKMPRSGGLAARIAASKGAVSASLTGKTASVAIRIANAQKDALAGLDEGTLRHPVYDTGTWVTQSVPKGAFSDAFKRGAPEAQDKVNGAIQDALEQIAREAD